MPVLVSVLMPVLVPVLVPALSRLPLLVPAWLRTADESHRTSGWRGGGIR